MNKERRFTILNHSDSETAKKLLQLAQQDLMDRWRLYEKLASPLADRAKTLAGNAAAVKEE